VESTLTLKSENSQENALSSTNAVLKRLNIGGSLHWIEDPATDLSGSDSIATFIEVSHDGCAVWVFSSAGSAKNALDSHELDFPSKQTYSGSDPKSGLGIILVSPYPGAACEFVERKYLVGVNGQQGLSMTHV